VLSTLALSTARTFEDKYAQIRPQHQHETGVPTSLHRGTTNQRYMWWLHKVVARACTIRTCTYSVQHIQSSLAPQGVVALRDVTDNCMCYNSTDCWL
jgi:hypothetical protein